MQQVMGLIVLIFSVSTFLLLAVGVLDVWGIVSDEFSEKVIKTWFLLCVLLGFSLVGILLYRGEGGD